MLKEASCEGVDWIYLAQDKDQWRAVMNTVMNRRVPLKTGMFSTRRAIISVSRRSVFHGVSYSLIGNDTLIA
jgi:hypothetical protein